MKQNLGTIDRIVRVALALALFILSLTGVISGVVAVIGIVVGVVLLLTAVVSFCPLYALLKLSTRRA